MSTKKRRVSLSVSFWKIFFFSFKFTPLNGVPLGTVLEMQTLCRWDRVSRIFTPSHAPQTHFFTLHVKIRHQGGVILQHKPGNFHFVKIDRISSSNFDFEVVTCSFSLFTFRGCGEKRMKFSENRVNLRSLVEVAYILGFFATFLVL